MEKWKHRKNNTKTTSHRFHNSTCHRTKQLLMKKAIKIISILILSFTPVLGWSQNNVPSSDKDKQAVVKINKLDVIYEDEEYSGIVIDQKSRAEDENTAYQHPFIVAPKEDDDDDDDEQIKVFQPVDDEGAESEEEILYASFDEETIHYPKLDVSKLKNPVHISLVDNAKGEKFVFPTPASARLTSHFGPRRRRFHYGIDLGLAHGEPIYAAFDGVVRISKFNRSYGNLIVIRHKNGLETYYAHLSKRNVIPGDAVKAGDIIGLCGNTGRSYGSHLHFEIRYMGNAMNPENVIDCASRELIDPDLNLTQTSFRKVAKRGAENKGSSASSSRGKQYYKVRSGDTLSKIAKRNGTTIKKLCKLNGLKETSTLSIGKRLRIK